MTFKKRDIFAYVCTSSKYVFEARHVPKSVTFPNHQDISQRQNLSICPAFSKPSSRPANRSAHFDRSHAEELLAVASHNDELAQRHLPGIYFGDILAVSSVGTDSGSAWHPFVCGTIAKYLVPDATSFDVVGPLVDSYLG